MVLLDFIHGVTAFYLEAIVLFYGVIGLYSSFMVLLDFMHGVIYGVISLYSLFIMLLNFFSWCHWT